VANGVAGGGAVGGAGSAGAGAASSGVTACDPAIAVPRQGAHEARRGAVVVQGAAQAQHGLRQGAIGQVCPPPHRGNQLVPTDRPLAVGDQVGQQIEHLGFDRYQRLAAPELALGHAEAECIEQVGHKPCHLAARHRE